MIKLGNWVGERTTTVGAGAIVMVGRLDGFASFSILGDGEVYYTIQDGIAKETGIGTLTGNVMERNKVSATIDSVGNYSTENTPIYLSGNAHVFCTANADFMAYLHNGIDTVDASALKALQSAEAAELSKQQAAQSAQAADSSKVAAAGSESKVAQSAADAAASASSALASKNAAATSENNAASSATKSANSATASETSAVNAKKSEANAQSAATAAAGSASAAASSQTAAANSVTAAKASETSAAGSATAADKSAKDAAASAAAASASQAASNASAVAAAASASYVEVGVRDSWENSERARLFAESAQNSEDAVVGNAQAAEASATAAKKSETDAATSALTAVNANMSAKNHATAAKQSRDEAEQIVNSIGTSVADAAASAEAAQRHEVAAQSAAGSAQDSASVAQLSEVGAVAAKDKAQEIADSIEGMVKNPMTTKGIIPPTADLNKMFKKEHEGYYVQKDDLTVIARGFPTTRKGTLAIIVNEATIESTGKKQWAAYQEYTDVDGVKYTRYNRDVFESYGFDVAWKKMPSKEDLDSTSELITADAESNTVIKARSGVNGSIKVKGGMTNGSFVVPGKIELMINGTAVAAELVTAEDESVIFRIYGGNMLVRPSSSGSMPIMGFEVGRDEWAGMARGDDTYNYFLTFVGTDAGTPSIINLKRGSGEILVDGSNTKPDNNGFYKRMSPVLTIDGDGNYTTNEESKDVVVTRSGLGVYELTNTLGYNSDKGWGVDGGISVPMDNNGLNLIYVDDRVNPDGSITIETFHRQHGTLPERFQNWRVKEVDESGNRIFYADGEPCDIPLSRYIDVRVNIPNGEAPQTEE